jgi:hypothetical protein
MPVPLDEFPVHQIPLSMAYPASSDRNFYDRCYLNAHDRSGDVFLISGFGVYPNLGVKDAYATVGRGDHYVTVRISDALTDDRMLQQVGPYRIDVVKPLEELHVVLDADAQGIGFDLTWTGSFPVLDEPAHVWRQNDRVILDAMRFAQVGSWSGTLRVEGETYDVTPDLWLGTRDRSWGIRPVGEAEPPGRGATEGDPDFGFWWVYAPLRFDDFAIVLIMQEDGNGTRVLNEARRVFPAGSGRPTEQLGWPEIDIRYQPGTRIPTGATVELRERSGRSTILEIETRGFVALNCGPGYGGDPDWTHGQWKGRNWIEGSTLDVSDPMIGGRMPFGVIDHVARCTYDGAEGWGMFEHASFGKHAPSGFADFGSVSD